MARPFTAQRFDLDSGGWIMRLTVDPSAGAGVAAPISTIALRENAGAGELWRKYGSGDTDWETIGAIVAHDLAGALHNADSFADLDSKISDASLAALGIAQQWTATQRSEVTTLDGSGANTSIAATASNSFYLNLEGNTQLDNPTGLAVGMWLHVVVEADGSSELTYGTYYDFGTEPEPDFSSMTDSEFIILTMYAKSATEIAVAASVIYG